MDVVYLLQAGGPKGPVYVGHCTDTGFRRRINTLQDHNPETLELKAVYLGSVELDVHLRDRWTEHQVRGRWHTARILRDLPDDTPRHERLERTERIRAAFEHMQALETTP